MRPLALIAILLISSCLFSLFIRSNDTSVVTPLISNEKPSQDVDPLFRRFPDLVDWKRPDGPLKVALQVGHWKNDDLPEELAKLRNNEGAVGGGMTEAEVNLLIAQETKILLEKEGIVVEILPATVPKGFWADALIAIHADSSTSARASGYKVAPPGRDYSGKGGKLASAIEKAYGKITRLRLDPNITENMTGYYAFSWWRFEHSMHPMTPAAIVETGFLTSPSDRKIIVKDHQKSAQGIASGIVNYLREINEVAILPARTEDAVF
jgi:hypothetical protein